MHDILMAKCLKKCNLMEMMVISQLVQRHHLVQNTTVKKTMNLVMTMPHKFIIVPLYDLEERLNTLIRPC